LANLQINPTLAKKIQTFNFGIDAANHVADIDYMPDTHGSVGLYGSTVDSESKSVRIRVELKGASHVFDQIVAENPGAAVVIKMDCEGSEHDIIPALAATGRLAQTKILMIETHLGRLDDIVAHLEGAGFNTFSYWLGGGGLGMVYAVRRA
jgi:FkbM family methyltransferase